MEQGRAGQVRARDADRAWAAEEEEWAEEASDQEGHVYAPPAERK